MDFWCFVHVHTKAGFKITYHLYYGAAFFKTDRRQISNLSTSQFITVIV